MSGFKYDTYIVLDLPEEIARKVIDIRSKFNDGFYMSLPAEITVAGSSGVGVLELEQEPSEVFSMLDSISSKFKPIKASFGKVMRFPYTNIFFLSILNEEPFLKLHQEISKSTIKFTPSKFPYKPHCTLCNPPSITTEEIEQLFALELPDEFILDTISVYALENNSTADVIVHLLHRVKLSGNE